MPYIKPTVNDFKQYFFRDFPYQGGGSPDLNFVQDQDITKAMSEASFNFNERLFSSQEKFSLGFLYLTAHYMVTDLQNSSQGIAGQYTWLTTSKAAGSVSEGSQVPQRILDNPEFAMISKTRYGAKYLSLLMPMLTGLVFTVPGRTKP